MFVKAKRNLHYLRLIVDILIAMPILRSVGRIIDVLERGISKASDAIERAKCKIAIRMAMEKSLQNMKNICHAMGQENNN